MSSCAHHVGSDGGITQHFEDMLYERPEAPAISLSATGVMESSVFNAKQDKFEKDLAAYEKGLRLCEFKRKMDGVCVLNAIAATCAPAISFIVGRKTDETR